MIRQSILFLSFFLSVLHFSDLHCYGQNQDSTLYTKVDSLPQFRYMNCADNKSCIDSFVSKNIVWPPGDADIYGRVYIQCVVEKDGTLSNFKILRGIDDQFDKASLDVVKLMPKWIPGIHKGKIVRSQIFIPVKWTLY
jgi:TonB family protein